MAQRQPEKPRSEKEHRLENEPEPEIDEEYLEQLRNDPDVIVHRRTATKPFVRKIILEEPVDVLWLIGRREKEWVDDEGDLPRT